MVICKRKGEHKVSQFRVEYIEIQCLISYNVGNNRYKR